MNAADIIHAFGGNAAVSLITGASRSAVSNWRHAGIPAKFWMRLINVAAERGIAGVTAETVQWRPVPVAEAPAAACDAAA